jgi:hypothetical protein
MVPPQGVFFNGMGTRSFLYSLFRRPELRIMELAFADPRQAQEDKLRAILSRNAGTVFGRFHGFARCSSTKEFRHCVPLSSYDDLGLLIDRSARGEKGILTAEDPFFFAVTSGTTGSRKLIPLTVSLERDWARAQVYWNSRLVRDKDAYGRWKYLALVSSYLEEPTEAGLPCGSISGRIISGRSQPVFRIPFLNRAVMAVPSAVFQVKDPAARLYLISYLALTSRIGNINTANPSSVVQFCRFMHENRRALAEDVGRGEVGRAARDALASEERSRLLPILASGEPRPRRAEEVEAALAEDPFSLRRLWPELELVNCWLGGTLSLYVGRLRMYSREVPLRDVGFRASEGFFAIPLENETAAGVLHVTGNFFEFIEEGSSGQDTLLVHEVEEGRRYRVFVTQEGGLYRYDMDDIIEVVGRYKNTPLVRFLHKTGGTLSLTGEKVTEYQAVSAVSRLQQEAGLDELDFCLTHSLDIPPAYMFFLESGPEGGKKLRATPGLAEFLDARLKEGNIEYKSKRLSGRLAPARVFFLEPGNLDALRDRHRPRGAFDTQFKPVHLVAQGEERDRLLVHIRGQNAIQP